MAEAVRYRLTYQQTLCFLTQLDLEEDLTQDFQPKKQLLNVFDNEETQLLSLRMPLMYPLPGKDESFSDYVKRIPANIPLYVTVLIQAGQAALGYFEKGEDVRHKVFRRYAVRRKHGKSQVKHVKKKGSKSAGGQLRMRQTQALFEDVNKKLKEWQVPELECPILYYCPTNLWQFLFSTKTNPSFDRKDERLRKIPRDIQTPSLEELHHTNAQVCSGWLQIDQPNWQYGLLETLIAECKRNNE